MEKTFNENYSSGFKTEILQDIYHVKDRVKRFMVKNHPDYQIATKGLNEIFGQLKIPQPE